MRFGIILTTFTSFPVSVVDCRDLFHSSFLLNYSLDVRRKLSVHKTLKFKIKMFITDIFCTADIWNVLEQIFH